MGIVYRARYVGNNRMVAVKLVPDEVAANPVLVTRFERELDVLKQLRHPHIVHCFGGICESKQRFYAMELVEGGTLHSLLREVGKLPWETVIDYGQQMSSALDYAHARNVIHRDVKPGNFLISRNGKLKLSDFGLAVVVASQRITAAGKTLGTFHYMAPEQIRGKPPVTGKTDLYALGCVLFEMLTGDPPYDAENAAEVLHKHLKEPIPSVRAIEPSCPVDLDRLITDLLQKDPDLRPPTAAIVGERLRAITSAPSTAVSSMSMTPTIPREVIRSEIDSSPAISSVALPPASTPRPLNGWLVVALVAMCLGLLFFWNSSAQWKSRAIKTESALKNLMQYGKPESKAQVIQLLGQLESLQPSTIKVLEEHLNSDDRLLRMAVVEMLAQNPQIAKSLRGDLVRMKRNDSDPEVRMKVEQAITASQKAESGTSWFPVILTWVIVLVVCALLVGLAWYAFDWARKHAMIPGL